MDSHALQQGWTKFANNGGGDEEIRARQQAATTEPAGFHAYRDTSAESGTKCSTKVGINGKRKCESGDISCADKRRKLAEIQDFNSRAITKDAYCSIIPLARNSKSTYTDDYVTTNKKYESIELISSQIHIVEVSDQQKELDDVLLKQEKEKDDKYGIEDDEMRKHDLLKDLKERRRKLVETQDLNSKAVGTDDYSFIITCKKSKSTYTEDYITSNKKDESIDLISSPKSIVKISDQQEKLDVVLLKQDDTYGIEDVEIKKQDLLKGLKEQRRKLAETQDLNFKEIGSESYYSTTSCRNSKLIHTEDVTNDKKDEYISLISSQKLSMEISDQQRKLSYVLLKKDDSKYGIEGDEMGKHDLSKGLKKQTDDKIDYEGNRVKLKRKYENTQEKKSSVLLKNQLGVSAHQRIVDDKLLKGENDTVCNSKGICDEIYKIEIYNPLKAKKEQSSDETDEIDNINKMRSKKEINDNIYKKNTQISVPYELKKSYNRSKMSQKSLTPCNQAWCEEHQCVVKMSSDISPSMKLRAITNERSEDVNSRTINIEKGSSKQSNRGEIKIDIEPEYDQRCALFPSAKKGPSVPIFKQNITPAILVDRKVISMNSIPSQLPSNWNTWDGSTPCSSIQRIPTQLQWPENKTSRSRQADSTPGSINLTRSQWLELYQSQWLELTCQSMKHDEDSISGLKSLTPIESQLSGINKRYPSLKNDSTSVSTNLTSVQSQWPESYKTSKSTQNEIDSTLTESLISTLTDSQWSEMDKIYTSLKDDYTYGSTILIPTTSQWPETYKICTPPQFERDSVAEIQSQWSEMNKRLNKDTSMNGDSTSGSMDLTSIQSQSQRPGFYKISKCDQNSTATRSMNLTSIDSKSSEVNMRYQSIKDDCTWMNLVTPQSQWTETYSISQSTNDERNYYSIPSTVKNIQSQTPPFGSACTSLETEESVYDNYKSWYQPYYQRKQSYNKLTDESPNDSNLIRVEIYQGFSNQSVGTQTYYSAPTNLSYVISPRASRSELSCHQVMNKRKKSPNRPECKSASSSRKTVISFASNKDNNFSEAPSFSSNESSEVCTNNVMYLEECDVKTTNSSNSPMEKYSCQNIYRIGQFDYNDQQVIPRNMDKYCIQEPTKQYNPTKYNSSTLNSCQMDNRRLDNENSKKSFVIVKSKTLQYPPIVEQKRFKSVNSIDSLENTCTSCQPQTSQVDSMITRQKYYERETKKETCLKNILGQRKKVLNNMRYINTIDNRQANFQNFALKHYTYRRNRNVSLQSSDQRSVLRNPTLNEDKAKKWNQLKGCSCQDKLNQSGFKRRPSFKDRTVIQPTLINQRAVHSSDNSRMPRGLQQYHMPRSAPEKNFTNYYSRYRPVNSFHRVPNDDKNYCKKYFCNKRLDSGHEKSDFDTFEEYYTSSEYEDVLNSEGKCSCCVCFVEVRTPSSIYLKNSKFPARLKSGGNSCLKKKVSSDNLLHDIKQIIANSTYYVASNTDTSSGKRSNIKNRSLFNVTNTGVRLRSGETKHIFKNKKRKPDKATVTNNKKHFWKFGKHYKYFQPSTVDVQNNQIKNNKVKSSIRFKYESNRTSKIPTLISTEKKTKISFKDELNESVAKKSSLRSISGSYNSHSYLLRQDVKILASKPKTQKEKGTDFFGSHISSVQLLPESQRQYLYPMSIPLPESHRKYLYPMSIPLPEENSFDQDSFDVSQHELHDENFIYPVIKSSETINIYSRSPTNRDANTSDTEDEVIGLKLKTGTSISESNLSLNKRNSTSSCYCSLKSFKLYPKNTNIKDNKRTSHNYLNDNCRNQEIQTDDNYQNIIDKLQNKAIESNTQNIFAAYEDETRNFNQYLNNLVPKKPASACSINLTNTGPIVSTGKRKYWNTSDTLYPKTSFTSNESKMGLKAKNYCRKKSKIPRYCPTKERKKMTTWKDHSKDKMVLITNGSSSVKTNGESSGLEQDHFRSRKINNCLGKNQQKTRETGKSFTKILLQQPKRFSFTDRMEGNEDATTGFINNIPEEFHWTSGDSEDTLTIRGSNSSMDYTTSNEFMHIKLIKRQRCLCKTNDIPKSSINLFIDRSSDNMNEIYLNSKLPTISKKQGIEQLSNISIIDVNSKVPTKYNDNNESNFILETDFTDEKLEDDDDFSCRETWTPNGSLTESGQFKRNLKNLFQSTRKLSQKVKDMGLNFLTDITKDLKNKGSQVEKLDEINLFINKATEVSMECSSNINPLDVCDNFGCQKIDRKEEKRLCIIAVKNNETSLNLPQNQNILNEDLTKLKKKEEMIQRLEFVTIAEHHNQKKSEAKISNYEKDSLNPDIGQISNAFNNNESSNQINPFEFLNTFEDIRDPVFTKVYNQSLTNHAILKEDFGVPNEIDESFNHVDLSNSATHKVLNNASIPIITACDDRHICKSDATFNVSEDAKILQEINDESLCQENKIRIVKSCKEVEQQTHQQLSSVDVQTSEEATDISCSTVSQQCSEQKLNTVKSSVDKTVTTDDIRYNIPSRYEKEQQCLLECNKVTSTSKFNREGWNTNENIQTKGNYSEYGNSKNKKIFVRAKIHIPRKISHLKLENIQSPLLRCQNGNGTIPKKIKPIQRERGHSLSRYQLLEQQRLKSYYPFNEVSYDSINRFDLALPTDFPEGHQERYILILRDWLFRDALPQFMAEYRNGSLKDTSMGVYVGILENWITTASLRDMLNSISEQLQRSYSTRLTAKNRASLLKNWFELEGLRVLLNRIERSRLLNYKLSPTKKDYHLYLQQWLESPGIKSMFENMPNRSKSSSHTLKAGRYKEDGNKPRKKNITFQIVD